MGQHLDLAVMLQNFKLMIESRQAVSAYTCIVSIASCAYACAKQPSTNGHLLDCVHVCMA